MPRSPRPICSTPNCRNRCTGRYCPQCKPKHNGRRGSSTKRGYGWRWRKVRNLDLQAEPFCVRCSDAGKVEAATVRDHIVPRRCWGVPWLAAWLRSIGAPVDPDDGRNLQSLCKTCHDRKTATEDGGFGRLLDLPVSVVWNEIKEGVGGKISGNPVGVDRCGGSRARSQNWGRGGME